MPPQNLARAFAVLFAAAALLATSLAARQQPTFRSGVDIVLIDVNVVDRSHKPVQGLRPEDFVVSVDGRPRKVASAQFIRYETKTQATLEKALGAPVPEPTPVAGPAPARNILIAIDVDSMEPGDGLMATGTAGTFDQYFERVATELSGSYLIGIEVQASDRDGRPHRVQVKVNQPNLDVRARKQYVIEAARAMAASPAPRTAVPPPSAPSPSNRPEPQAVDPAREAQALLPRVVKYVTAYRQEYSAVVADEDYRQETTTERAHLRSDLLLVKTPEEEAWVSFRDVYEVNGVAVRDRADRLRKLFLDPTAEAKAQLAKIKDESARYNIGDVDRNVNVPLFPLLFLHPGNLQRFDFETGEQRETKGVRVREIRFVERQRPTIVANMHASGWFLVDAASGAVVETGTYYVDSMNQSAEIVVQYARDSALGMWVPAEMNEVYKGRTGTLVVKGTATYSKFRRFQVTTEEKIKIPKR